jgi:hypothetical protein
MKRDWMMTGLVGRRADRLAAKTSGRTSVSVTWTAPGWRGPGCEAAW